MIPNGIEVVDADENVSVSVNIEKIATSKSLSKTEYINLPENLELVSIQGDIKVTLRGRSWIADARTVKYYVD